MTSGGGHPTTIPGLLARSVERDAAKLAVVGPKDQLTYGELDVASSQIANALVARGVAPGDRVALRMQKSVWSLAAAYGIMKAGACYVPLDVKEPGERSAKAIVDAGATVAVAEPNRGGKWTDLDDAGLQHVLAFGKATEATLGGAAIATSAEVLAGNDASPDVTVAPDDLAYILYTSGSTGRRKGVMLTHANSLGFVNWAADTVNLTADDRLSSHAPMHFDLSTFDFYSTANAGATVHIVPPTASMFPPELAAFIAERQITVWYSVPTILRMLVDKGGVEPGAFEQLRTIIFAGEVFPPAQLNALMTLLPDKEYWNWFGPTETNVCTAYKVPRPPDPDGAPVSIGRASSGATALVVDENDELVADGDPGELLIDGPTVLAGYWNNPEKTASVRTPHPFDPDRIVFRTGDMVQLDANGDFTFLGRNDHQIKTRGYRVELGEIETFLARQPDVTQAAVVPVEDSTITNKLHAFIAAPDDARKVVLKACRQDLPAYMVPASITCLPELPLTLNHKIDRQQLTARATASD